ncbi:MAG TPA: sulfite exporter TauE/SafE family protein [Chitinophagaceae bacterium]|nr:sulfite exporter TauE/SafE family protein [Chitinophagaceae bacterium]
MEIAGYFASALIGISLGLIGGGGSILTVPVLVYLFSISPLLATSYSLFIVGSTSLIGAFNNFRRGYVNFRIALLFGISSILTVFLTRRFIVHAIPEEIGKIGNFVVTEALLTMVLFAILMLAASFSMIRNGSKSGSMQEAEKDSKGSLSKLFLYGIGVGFVTGLLGAGGGFLLIPALVLLMKLPMKEAVGTSLLIIAMNSLFGFAVDLAHFDIDWHFLIVITLIAAAGIFMGGAMARRIPGEKLKKAFGWFVLIMGIYIMVKELLVPNL